MPPSVSVLLATCDRPHLLPITLKCFTQQTLSRRELIVIDDGANHPANERLVQQAGGRLICAPPGTPLGAKLNIALEHSTGSVVCKWDDDDWYAPAFLETMHSAVVENSSSVVAFVQPFLFFRLTEWDLRKSDPDRCSGATLTTRRELLERCRFRPIPREVDGYLLLDLMADGVSLHPVATDDFIQLRHSKHIWNHMPDGETVVSYLERAKPYPCHPEDILPDWAILAYRRAITWT